MAPPSSPPPPPAASTPAIAPIRTRAARVSDSAADTDASSLCVSSASPLDTALDDDASVHAARDWRWMAARYGTLSPSSASPPDLDDYDSHRVSIDFPNANSSTVDAIPPTIPNSHTLELQFPTTLEYADCTVDLDASTRSHSLANLALKFPSLNSIAPARSYDSVEFDSLTSASLSSSSNENIHITSSISNFDGPSPKLPLPANSVPYAFRAPVGGVAQFANTPLSLPIPRNSVPYKTMLPTGNAVSQQNILSAKQQLQMHLTPLPQLDLNPIVTTNPYPQMRPYFSVKHPASNVGANSIVSPMDARSASIRTTNTPDNRGMGRSSFHKSYASMDRKSVHSASIERKNSTNTLRAKYFGQQQFNPNIAYTANTGGSGLSLFSSPQPSSGSASPYYTQQKLPPKLKPTTGNKLEGFVKKIKSMFIRSSANASSSSSSSSSLFSPLVLTPLTPQSAPSTPQSHRSRKLRTRATFGSLHGSSSGSTMVGRESPVFSAQNLPPTPNFRGNAGAQFSRTSSFAVRGNSQQAPLVAAYVDDYAISSNGNNGYGVSGDLGIGARNSLFTLRGDAMSEFELEWRREIGSTFGLEGSGYGRTDNMRKYQQQLLQQQQQQQQYHFSGMDVNEQQYGGGSKWLTRKLTGGKRK
ncbi:hypothetical protein HDU84_004949 [Entophlyctis sp. JEL0112]|nr:hypothetical protein HDU84_004949 [Entophlyctis sp. JEL0112]